MKQPVHISCLLTDVLRKSGKGAKKPKVDLTDRTLGQELGQDLGGPTCPLCDKGVQVRFIMIGELLRALRNSSNATDNATNLTNTTELWS